MGKRFLIIAFAALCLIAGSYIVSAQISGGGGNIGGDVIGAMTRTVVRAIQGRPVANTTPQTNQALCWTGSQWAPGNCSGGSGSGGGNCILISSGNCLQVSNGSSLLIQ